MALLRQSKPRLIGWVLACLALAAVRWPQAALGGALEVGKPFPSVSLVDGDAREAPAVAKEAPLVLVQVWATWCAPCHEALPRLLEAVRAESGGEILVVLWNIDTELARAKRYLEMHGLAEASINLRFDPGGREFTRLGAPGMPTTILVSYGKIVALFAGYSPETERGIVAALREARRKQQADL